MQKFFPHERQKVYVLSLEWATWVGQFVEKTGNTSLLKSRLLDHANTMPVTIAEGLSSTRASQHERLEAARDSIIASSALLDVIDLSQKIDTERMLEAKRHLNMLSRHLGSIIQAASTADAIRSKLAAPN